jgi:hypothetical protein
MVPHLEDRVLKDDCIDQCDDKVGHIGIPSGIGCQQ